MKPIGSEKLTGEAKIQRIKEIALYGTKKNDINESKTEFSKVAVDGNTYAVVREKDGYYVKVGLNESSLDYVDGMLNKNKNKFRSFSGALKKINLMLKPLNEEFNEGNPDPILEEKKFVLKRPESDEPVADEPLADDGMEDELDLDSLDFGGDSEEPEMDMGSEDDMEMDMDSEEPEMDMDSEEPEMDEDGEEDKIKKIQKLTGKLGQKLREAKLDLESSDIKYVLNSIISALDLSNLNEEDLEDVMENFEELENFEVQGGESEPEMGDELPMDDEMEFADEDLPIEEPEEEMAEGEEFDTELDEGQFMDGLKSLGSKFIDFYTNNPAGREGINKAASSLISKGTDKASEKIKNDKVSGALKDFNPSSEDIEQLGRLMFGGLNESEVSKKIDNVLEKYFK